MADPTLIRAFRFQVKLRRSAGGEAGKLIPNNAPSGDQLGDGAFQECSGLEIEMDVQEYQEGGRNDGTIRRAGRAKYSNVVLKRGMFFPEKGKVNQDLWRWIQEVLSGVRPIRRYDGIIQVMNVGQEDLVATWVFDRGLPAKIRGPEFNAKTGEIAIEELHIAHEGLRFVAP